MLHCDPDGSWASAIYMFGFPTVSAGWHLQLGPVALRAAVKVPARFAVIPCYFSATQACFEAGFRF